MRDTQRSKIYKSERAALWPLASPLPSVSDVEKFCKKQLSRAAVQRRWPRAGETVQVHDGGGRRAACAWGGYKISIPLWARSDVVVLHELAHIICARQFRRQEIAGHGWQFAGVFLDLIRICKGRAAHDALKAAFKENRVAFKPPRPKRVLTPEQREKLIERLQSYRQAA